MSSQTNFDFNQIIESSLYERFSIINKYSVTLIDYAAFFGSVKCFKYLLMNGAKVSNTGKYAVAGGNLEIIHLCEQNHSSFDNAYEIAIEFHRNEIFKYIYENKLEKLDEKSQMNELGKKCIKYNNYQMFSSLLDKIEISTDIITEAAIYGNLYLIKSYLNENNVPKNILVLASGSGNVELVKYLIEEKGINSINNNFDINFIYIYHHNN